MATPRNRKATATPEAAIAATVTLADVIAATERGEIIYTSPEFHTPLVQAGKVEINPSMVNESGMIATRAIRQTPETYKEETKMTQAQKPSFEIESGVELPQRVRKVGVGVGRSAVYPFEQLEIGQSFFVPNESDDKPAAKKMASTVATANIRYSEEIPGQTRTNRKGATVPATRPLRKFQVFDTDRTLSDGTVQKGARIFRMKLEG